MKKSSRIISTLLLGATLSCSALNVFAVESNKTIHKKILMGQTRYETAVKASVQGWKGASDAVLVNGGAIVDALSATPYAKMKNAPILLIQKDCIPSCTLDELKRLNVSKVTVVGGEGVISNNVIKDLNALGIKVERIGGSNRFETSLNLANKLEKVLNVAIVNGNDESLSDAMSVATPTARENMAILLTDGKNLKGANTYIKNRNIKHSYIIGGEGVVSSKIEKSVNGIRIGGADRRETNGKVLKEFYGKDDKFDNVYLVKDGSNDTFENGRLKNSELVDALSIGSLASKENSPVILAGDKLSDSQEEFLSNKQAKFLYEIGGIKTCSIDKIYDILCGIKKDDSKPSGGSSGGSSSGSSSSTHKKVVVNNIKDLQNAIKNCKAKDTLSFNPNKEVKEKIDLTTDKDITIELNGSYAEEITVNVPNGDVINNGILKKGVKIKNVKEGTFINNGTIICIVLEDKDGSVIFNKENAVLNKIIILEEGKVTVSGNVKEVLVEGKNSKVNLIGQVDQLSLKGEKIEVNIKDNCKINNLTTLSNAANLDIASKADIKEVYIGRECKNINIKNKGTVEKLKVIEGATGIKINCSKGKIKEMKGNEQFIVEGKENIEKLDKINEDPSKVDKELIDKAKEKLNLGDLSNIESNLKLPKNDGVEVNISWKSNNNGVINADGVVTTPEKDTEVILTATLTKGKESATKEFKAIVKGKKVEKVETEEEINNKAVGKAKVDLTLENLDAVINDLTLPNELDGVPIQWESGNTTVISNDGKITRPKAGTGDIIVNLKAKLSKGIAKEEKNFTVTVKQKEFTTEELLQKAKNALELGKLNNVVDDIALPALGEFNSKITWTSSDAGTITNDGKVIRPDRTVRDKNVTLTAAIEINGQVEQKEFNVIVKAKTNSTEEELALIKESLNIENEKNITENIDLQTSVNGANISWISSSINVITNDGKVIRPENKNGDANVTLTATISKDGKSEVREFNLTVKEKENNEINSPAQYYDAVKKALENFETNVKLKINNYNDKDYNLEIFNKVVLEHPDINYGYSQVQGGICPSLYGNEAILNLTIGYRLPKAKMIQEKNDVKAKIDEIIRNEIKPGMTAIEKEVALHDYIVKNARYDIEKVNQNPPVPEDHNAYGVLCLGIGVCESYAKATYQLFNTAGIECKYVTGLGNGGPHAWNMVKLEGDWYNLDVTWDDPVTQDENNKLFPVQYNYFNTTDSTFGNHIRDEKLIAYPKCTATKYTVDNLSDIIKFIDKDGKEYKTVKSINELDNVIKDGIKNKKTEIHFRVKDFNMDINQLSIKVKDLLQGTDASRMGYSSLGECFTVTIEWRK